MDGKRDPRRDRLLDAMLELRARYRFSVRPADPDREHAEAWLARCQAPDSPPPLFACADYTGWAAESLRDWEKHLFLLGLRKTKPDSHQPHRDSDERVERAARGALVRWLRNHR